MSLTDPRLECLEPGYSVKRLRGEVTQGTVYTACAFERTVYKASWEGGGSISTRVVASINK